MKCKDLIKIIQDQQLEDYEIFDIDLDYTFKTGDFALAKNFQVLPYPEYKDVFTDLPAERYDHVSIQVNMEDGTVISRVEGYYDSSTKEYYPY